MELNTNYELIITTNAGLWRYRIGDTIRFTCLSPYRIQVTGRTKSHINPAVINTYLIRIGYKGLLTAHGIRAIPLTMGQEVLGFDSDIIQRQLAHAIGDKIRQAYDRSQFWEERKKFMIAWCDALTAEGLIT